MQPDDARRPSRLRSPRLGTDGSVDAAIYQEDDPQMWGGLGLSPDKTKLLLELGNSEVTETHILDLTQIAAPLEMVISREDHSLHDVLPVGDQYLITHNRAADGTHLPNNQVSIVDAD